MPAIQHIGAHVITRLDRIRALLIDDTHEIQFTPTEYRLILRFLEGQPISDQELVSSVFNGKVEYDLWTRETLDRHVDNIRRKFKQHHLKMRILRISSFGYILVSVPSSKAN